MSEVETAFYKVENGTVCEFDLPLKSWAVGRATSGVWQRVNEDGSPWSESPDVPPPVPEKPGRNDTKSAWVGYAMRVHGMTQDDAEAMTKLDLIERFGS